MERIKPWRNTVVTGRKEQDGFVSYDPITVARFWSKVTVMRSDAECWPWKGATKTLGYGRIKVKGQSLTASRVAWELFTGLSLGDRFALHRCDNPACCNPLHIYAGDVAMNGRDSVHERAKQKIFAQIGPAKKKRLNLYQATQIKAALACGMKEAEIADQLGIAVRVVAEIRRGDTFQEAPQREDLIRDFRIMLGAAVKDPSARRRAKA